MLGREPGRPVRHGRRVSPELAQGLADTIGPGGRAEGHLLGEAGRRRRHRAAPDDQHRAPGLLYDGRKARALRRRHPRHDRRPRRHGEPGDQASACGISGSDAVCWGAGYSPADNPSLPVRVVLDRTPVSRAAVFDEPPRSGPSPGAPSGASSGAWDASCRIHFGCERATPPLAACAPSMKGEAWTTSWQANALAGTKVSVRGPLTLNPVTRARGWRGVPSASMVALSVQCGPTGATVDDRW